MMADTHTANGHARADRIGSVPGTDQPLLAELQRRLQPAQLRELADSIKRLLGDNGRTTTFKVGQKVRTKDWQNIGTIESFIDDRNVHLSFVSPEGFPGEADYSIDDIEPLEGERPQDIVVARGEEYPLHNVRKLIELQRPPYVIKGVIRRGQLIVNFGPPGGGKTLVIVDMMFSVLTGMPWRGRRVKKGTVVYMALEGRVGLRQRLLARCDGHPDIALKLENLLIGWESFSIHDPQHVARLIAAVRKLPETPAMIVVDTLSRAVPGADENSAQDMSRVVAHIDAIKEQTGAAVFVNHHSAKGDPQRERGSGVLRAGADVMLITSVTKEAGMSTFTLTADRLRDDEEFGKLVWRGELVTLDTDEDGEPVTGMRLVPTDRSGVSDVDAQDAAKLARHHRQTASDAAVLAVILADMPGLPLRRLHKVAKARAAIGKDRVDVALEHIGERAVRLLPGKCNADLHYLDGSQIGQLLLGMVPIPDQPRVSASRPPDTCTTATAEDKHQ